MTCAYRLNKALRLTGKYGRSVLTENEVNAGSTYFSIVDKSFGTKIVRPVRSNKQMRRIVLQLAGRKRNDAA